MSKYIPGGLALVHHGRLPALFVGPLYTYTPPKHPKMVTHTRRIAMIFCPRPHHDIPGHFQRPLSHHLARVTKTIFLLFYIPIYKLCNNLLAPSNRVIYLFTRGNLETPYNIYTSYIVYTSLYRPSWDLQTPIIYIIVEITLREYNLIRIL